MICGVEVVDRDREVVERRAVGAGDHRVIHVRVGEPRLAADRRPPRRSRRRRGRAAGPRPSPRRLAAEAAVGAVLFLVGPDVFGGRRRVVGVAALEQLLRAPRAWRARVRVWKIGPSSQSSFEPPQGVEDLLDVLGGRSLPVGIFDPQHSRPPGAARQQPVVEGRPGAADVQRSGRGWSKANAHEKPSPHANRRPRFAGRWPVEGDRAWRRARLQRDPDLQSVAADVAADGLRRGRLRAFREAMAPSGIKAVLIHAVYLINCASRTRRSAQVTGLADQSLRVGDGIGAVGVVLHPGIGQDGRRAEGDQPRGQGDRRGARANPSAAPAPREHGRRRRHARALVRGAGGAARRGGGDRRLGLCLDSCHLFASGYDIRTPEALTETLDECERVVGPSGSRSLHLNDSHDAARLQPRPPRDPRRGRAGRRRLRDVPVGAALRAAPCVLETGRDNGGVTAEDVAAALQAPQSAARRSRVARAGRGESQAVARPAPSAGATAIRSLRFSAGNTWPDRCGGRSLDTRPSQSPPRMSHDDRGRRARDGRPRAALAAADRRPHASRRPTRATATRRRTGVKRPMRFIAQEL